MKTILVDAVDTFVSEKGEIFQEMHDLLEKYPNKKIIVTNAGDDMWEEFGLSRMPYEVFSLKHNPDKPDPVYFQKLLEHFNLNPADVIYFEHNPEAVKSAESCGIVSYHYDETKKDLEALKSFLDQNL